VISMALSYTVKATQTDGKPVVLVYRDASEALQSVTGLMMADHICEVHVFIRQGSE